MFRTDYDQETMPFIVEGEHVQVLGVGEVTGRIAVAQTPIDIVTNPVFSEPGVIPVVLDEFSVSDEKHGCLDQVAGLLRTGLWPGFVTFGSSEMIRSRRLLGAEPSHFMIFLRALAEQGDFLAVVDNDESNRGIEAMLRSEIGIFNGAKSILRAVSPNMATIEYDNELR